MKICKKCGIEHDESFYPTYSNRGKISHLRTCRICVRKYFRDYRKGEQKRKTLCQLVVLSNYRLTKITLSDGSLVVMKKLNQDNIRDLIKDGYLFIFKKGFSKYLERDDKT